MSVRVAAIVAMGRNRAIGFNNSLLWKLPGDLPRLKKITMGKPLIMGRKTFDSIGKPLPGRTNIVVTRQPDFKPEGCVIVRDPGAALATAVATAEADQADEVIVFGGADIYAALLDQTDRIYLTDVDDSPEADAFFPHLNEAEWEETLRAPQTGAPPFSYVVMDRR